MEEDIRPRHTVPMAIAVAEYEVNSPMKINAPAAANTIPKPTDSRLTARVR